jgi:hypothetical protein
MIFHPKDTNRRHFMCVKFKLNRYRFAVVIAISFGLLGGHFFPDTVYMLPKRNLVELYSSTIKFSF